MLSAYDFQRYKDDEVIGFHRALPPFKLHRMDWRQHPMLQKRKSVPPPQLPILSVADVPVTQLQDRSYYIDPDCQEAPRMPPHGNQ